MAYNPLAGKAASINIGSTAYAFDVAKVEIKNGLGKVTNFNSGGYDQFITGIMNGKLELEGTYDEGNMAFTVGNSYTVIVTYTNSVTLSCPCILEDVAIDIKVADPQ